MSVDPDPEWTYFRHSMLKLAIVIAAAMGWAVGIMQQAIGIPVILAAPLFLIGITWAAMPYRRR